MFAAFVGLPRETRRRQFAVVAQIPHEMVAPVTAAAPSHGHGRKGRPVADMSPCADQPAAIMEVRTKGRPPCVASAMVTPTIGNDREEGAEKKGLHSRRLWREWRSTAGTQCPPDCYRA
ncbi:hypothetical protein D3870_18080 [Noviherbaspirillum cavernae]|uniref:Uncharacterized protein n=1 Tax=Noviherbaspirillum cavernae TaxID=2320862 RepID=A0A418X5E7_9BURK|nr:hypothetical protein [Noviherbaspirillum cavernae]RJG07650.1 hypothetical protein D3870_18080 [Noviherbaspirillum cavernae]